MTGDSQSSFQADESIDIQTTGSPRKMTSDKKKQLIFINSTYFMLYVVLNIYVYLNL